MHLGGPNGEAFTKIMMLNLTPNVFVGIDLWSVRWQIVEVARSLGVGDELLRFGRTMRIGPANCRN